MPMMILKRLMMAIPSLIGVVIVTFLLTRALPGDPAAYFAGPAATKEAIEEIRVKLGLDQPLYVQFARYVADLAHGDLGNSLTTGIRTSVAFRHCRGRLVPVSNRKQLTEPRESVVVPRRRPQMLRLCALERPLVMEFDSEKRICIG